MYKALGNKLNTLSESDLMEELERLAVVENVADVQAMNSTPRVNMEKPAKKLTNHKTPTH